MLKAIHVELGNLCESSQSHGTSIKFNTVLNRQQCTLICICSGQQLAACKKVMHHWKLASYLHACRKGHSRIKEKVQSIDYVNGMLYCAACVMGGGGADFLHALCNVIVYLNGGSLFGGGGVMGQMPLRNPVCYMYLPAASSDHIHTCRCSVPNA